MKHNPLKYSLFVLALAFTQEASAQLNVASNSNPVDLANKLVGAGVSISNAAIKCPPGGSGSAPPPDCP